MKNQWNKEEVIDSLEGGEHSKSRWSAGVYEYALEIIDNIFEDERVVTGDLTFGELKKAMLNGAENWKEYSWGGCSLIYNEDIAERLCTPSELKRTKNGKLRPNKNEEWLDTQARALYQASLLVEKAITKLVAAKFLGE